MAVEKWLVSDTLDFVWVCVRARLCVSARVCVRKSARENDET